jgi:hypothetical protein
MFGCSKEMDRNEVDRNEVGRYEVGRKDMGRKEVGRCSSTPTRARDSSGASRGRLPRECGRDRTRGVIPGFTREGWAEDKGEKKKASARARARKTRRQRQKVKARTREGRLTSPLGKWRTELTTSPVGPEMRTMGEDRAKRGLALEESLERLEKEGIVRCMRARLRKRRGGWIA